MSSIRDSNLPPTVDARAPRFNQAIIGVAALAAYLLGFWPLLTLAALQLALTLTFGPRLCLGCLVYLKLVRPRIGPGPVKDARPVRFALRRIGLPWSRDDRAHRGVCAPGLGVGAHRGWACPRGRSQQLLRRLRDVPATRPPAKDHLEAHFPHRPGRARRDAGPGPGGAVHVPPLHRLQGPGRTPA